MKDSINFYDIESLANVFSLANFKEKENEIDVYFLIDNEEDILEPNYQDKITSHIKEVNVNFNGTVNYYNLKEEHANVHLAKTFGLSDSDLVNNKKIKDSFDNKYRIKCDTDDDYDSTKDPYFMGYNSHNYDTTMLAVYFYNAFTGEKGKFEKTTAKSMRESSDMLFTEDFKHYMPYYLTYNHDELLSKKRNGSKSNFRNKPNKIRNNMILTGRHVDVANLTDTISMTLKRVMGMLGLQIKESDKLKGDDVTITNFEEFKELISYNINDIVNLKHVFYHPIYKNKFDLKRGLLKRFPELIYNELGDTYKPDVKGESVRRNRLMPSSTSAKFATFCIAPYHHLTDIETVSYMYPHADIAKKMGVKQINVLEEVKKFFYENFPQEELRKQFDPIYKYYKSIEGKNFNFSQHHINVYGVETAIDEETGGQIELGAEDITRIPRGNTLIPYFDKDGNPTSAYVLFSVGGIHGAEYNKKLLDLDLKIYLDKLETLCQIRKDFNSPQEFFKSGLYKYKGKYVKKELYIKKPTKEDKNYYWTEIKEPTLLSPAEQLKLNEKYKYVSYWLSIHQDFSSYYPNLLRNLKAFWNDRLGYDRYGGFYDDKETLGKKQKDPNISEKERIEYGIQREGVKLILNSATGVANATSDNNILISNTIISMRIIGQLFTYMVGQAQALHGAIIPSTNTDGLYTVLEETLSEELLKRESEKIHIKIDPELMYLITKDSNNRMEIAVDEDKKPKKIIGNSGSALTAVKGPNPTKQLVGPASMHWALSEYLFEVAKNPNRNSYQNFDKDLAKSIFERAKNEFDKVKYLIMMQSIVASNKSSDTYTFGTDPKTNEIVYLQDINRAFLVKDTVEDTLFLQSATAKAITPATRKKRAKAGTKAQEHNSIALKILEHKGLSINQIPMDKEAAIKKITDLENNWHCLIENKDLHYLSDERLDFIIDNLDLDKYTTILESRYIKSWKNPNMEEERQKIIEVNRFKPKDIKVKNSNKETFVLNEITTPMLIEKLKVFNRPLIFEGKGIAKTKNMTMSNNTALSIVNLLKNNENTGDINVSVTDIINNNLYEFKNIHKDTIKELKSYIEEDRKSWINFTHESKKKKMYYPSIDIIKDFESMDIGDLL